MSGAMDPLGLQVANLLVGNPPGAAALEVTGPGVVLRIWGRIALAIAGADLDATLSGRPLRPFDRAIAVDQDVLRFGKRRRGFRAVVAWAGGIAVKPVLGSASMHPESGVGPPTLGPRLQTGAMLELAWSARRPPRLPVPGDAVTALLSAIDAQYAPADLLRFVPAREDLARAACDILWTVSSRANRTGYRLEGPNLWSRAKTRGLSTTAPFPIAHDRLSEPTQPGALQLPPDGCPILLMADAQTLGGYPHLGFVATADRARAAQLAPGDHVRLSSITLAEARALITEQSRLVSLLEAPIF